MADGTHIEWTDATWNPITGCSIVSKGCTNCYAMKLAGTRLRHHPSRAGLTRETKAGPVWTGEVRFNEQWLDQPLRWKAPRKIFVCAHGDLFAEGVPDAWIDRVFAVMALASHHTFQVLTKRPARMRAYLDGWAAHVRIERLLDAMKPSPQWNGNVVQAASRLSASLPLLNVWLGVSAEDQATADARVPELLETPAAVRFVSAEPLLGPNVFPAGRLGLGHNGAFGTGRLDWIIVGGESGPGARPMHPDWARSIRDQCQYAGVAFLFKQWGEHEVVYDRDREDPDWRLCAYVERRTRRGRWLNLNGGHGFHGERVVRVNPVGKAAAGRILDDRTWDEYPIDGATR